MNDGRRRRLELPNPAIFDQVGTTAPTSAADLALPGPPAARRGPQNWAGTNLACWPTTAHQRSSPDELSEPEARI